MKIGGKTVEVCCDDCARKLKEAHAAAKREMLSRFVNPAGGSFPFGWLSQFG